MDKKIVGLVEGTNVAPINKDVVASLERLLEEAKRGEIQSFAFAAVRPCGDSVTGWNNRAHYHHLLGALLVVQNRLLNE